MKNRKIKKHSHYHTDMFPRRHPLILPRYKGGRDDKGRILLLQRRYPWGSITQFGIEWVFRNKPMWEGEPDRYQNLRLGQRKGAKA